MGPERGGFVNPALSAPVESNRSQRLVDKVVGSGSHGGWLPDLGHFGDNKAGKNEADYDTLSLDFFSESFGPSGKEGF